MPKQKAKAAQEAVEKVRATFPELTDGMTLRAVREAGQLDGRGLGPERPEQVRLTLIRARQIAGGMAPTVMQVREAKQLRLNGAARYRRRNDARITPFMRFLDTHDAWLLQRRLRAVDDKLHALFARNHVECSHTRKDTR